MKQRNIEFRSTYTLVLLLLNSYSATAWNHWYNFEALRECNSKTDLLVALERVAVIWKLKDINTLHPDIFRFAFRRQMIDDPPLKCFLLSQFQFSFDVYSNARLMTWNECWRTEGWWVFLIISAYFLSIRQWIYLFIHVQVYKLVYHFQYSHDDRISIYIICLRYQYWIIMTIFDAGSKDVGRDFDICYYHMWSRILFKGFTISRGIKHFFLRKWTFNSQ